MKLKWLIAPTKFLANIGNIALSYNSAKFRPLWVFEKRRPKSAALLAFRSREVPPLNGRLLPRGWRRRRWLPPRTIRGRRDGWLWNGWEQANWAHTHSPVGWALGLLSPMRPSSGGGRGSGGSPFEARQRRLEDTQRQSMFPNPLGECRVRTSRQWARV